MKNYSKKCEEENSPILKIKKGDEERRKDFPSLVCSAHCMALPVFIYVFYRQASSWLQFTSYSIWNLAPSKQEGKENQMGWRGETELTPQLK